jgi:hypothetical protein
LTTNVHSVSIAVGGLDLLLSAPMPLFLMAPTIVEATCQLCYCSYQDGSGCPITALIVVAVSSLFSLHTCTALLLMMKIKVGKKDYPRETLTELNVLSEGSTDSVSWLTHKVT